MHPNADAGFSNACPCERRRRGDLGRHGLGGRDHHRRGRRCGFSLTVNHWEGHSWGQGSSLKMKQTVTSVVFLLVFRFLKNPRC